MRKARLFMKAWVMGMLVMASVLAAYSPVESATIITTEQLQSMLKQKRKYVLIDARSPQEYEDAHIIGAVNIPEKAFNKYRSRLPKDKNSLLIIYCNGVKCGKSKRLAKKIEPLGYANITVYAEGFPVWEEKGLRIVAGPEYGKKIETKKLTPRKIQSIIEDNKKEYVIVDVRDEDEFEAGHIPTAINIPADTFAAQSGILPKKKKIVVYCNTGSRSYLAYRKLMGLAYKNIYQTLFAEWKDEGMPIE